MKHILEHVFGPPGRTDVVITNCYDACLNRRGSLDDRQVRNIGVEGAVVDVNTLSVSLPAEIIEFLGLAGAGSGGRLTPVEITIRGRTCTVDPFESACDQVVIGRVPLIALGLTLDPDGWLIDDPFPSR
jgi:hypothetical protein